MRIQAGRYSSWDQSAHDHGARRRGSSAQDWNLKH
jgi:hypothetical protein